MKMIKTLLASGVLVAAAGANAAIISPFTDTQSGSGSAGTAVFTLNGTDTGSLDTVSGVLTITGTGTFAAPAFGVNMTMTTTEVLNGSVSGNTWTPTGTGTYTFSNVPAGPFQSLIPTAPQAISGATGSVSLLSGATSTVNSTITMNIVGTPVAIALQDTLTAPAAPAVPVPAAAWLFGSGLLGLAGTARRRAKA